ncbi:MAG TPA: FlgD immunoglobulin-like domain containing protein [Candidatus Eisenbacteria bacterium]|nr:FlgD immunoglobulin-like domain containing protein [Candidatus Eisenbacteria bacterium]
MKLHPRRPAVAALLAGLAASILLAPPAYSLFVREDLWAPDGPVRAITQSNNTIYIGGSFSLVGPHSGPAVAIDYFSATAQTPYPRVNGVVRAVEPDGNGGWYLGGSFTAVQGQLRNNLAHINADGAVTPWNPDVNGEVHDIALGSGVVYVAGVFSAVGPTARSYVAAIDSNTGLALAFTCTPNGAVTELEFAGSEVYIGGAFTTVNGDPREHLAALQATTGTPTFFHAGVGSGLTDATALEFSDGKLFLAVNSSSGHVIKVLDPVTGYLPYNVITNGPVHDFLPDGALVYIGGNFSTVGGQSRLNLAAVVVATGAVSGWSVNTDGEVRALAEVFIWSDEIFIDVLVVGGNFSMVGASSRSRLAVINKNPTFVLGWSANLGGGDVHCLEEAGGTIYAGGDFSIINGIARNNLAALSAVSGHPFDWAPVTNGEVEALMVSGNTVYVGGEFSTVNGVVRNRAASVDAVSGSLTAFDPNVNVDFPTTVRAFARDGSTIYMAGAFSTVGGVPRGGIAAVDATTGGVSSWNPNVNGSVYAMGIIIPFSLNPPTIVIGGQFTVAGGQPRNNLAALNGSTGLATSWNPNANASVHSLIVLPTTSGGINRVYAGGAFSTIGGQSRNRLAILDGTGAATTWNPSPNGAVYAMALSGNTLIAGGAFTSIGITPRSHIAAIDLNSGAATAWAPEASGGLPDGEVDALLRLSGTIYAGGTFARIAGTFHGRLAGVSDAAVTAVEPEPSPESASLRLRAAPNPFVESTTIRFSLASAVRTRVAVYDVAGRRVREIHEGWLPAGTQMMVWDGRDQAGRLTAAGTYFLGVQTETGTLRTKLHRAR